MKTLRAAQCLILPLVALSLAAPVCSQRARAAGKVDINVPPGFRVEQVYAPPLGREGSWVSMCVDDRGRLIASDQEGALYRLTPAPLGRPAALTKVERIPLAVGMAQGLTHFGGKLYVMLNGMRGALSPGLYRLSDTDGDDQYDRVEQLRVWQGMGEHGPHAVVPAPDGRHLYVCCGNQTKLPLLDGTLVPNFWRDDRLLPPLFAAALAGHPAQTPGGWIAKLDPETERLTLVAVGFRNIYDLAFNKQGELFTFDADAESEIGLPWYRPTRVCHVPSGVDFGWRAADGKWSEFSIDSLPAAVNVGQGSPTGLAFGYETKFPAPYRNALFAGDWALGMIYAVHLRADGAGYGGEFRVFASGTPLAVTDLVVRPQDGALYVVVGGRKSQSAIYRIYWRGGAEIDPSQAPTPLTEDEAAAAAQARQLRHELEAFHTGADPSAVAKAWPHLAATDATLRSAARIAVEHQPIEAWGEQALNEPDPRRRIAALAALARVGSPALAPVWTESLTQLPLAELPRADQLDALRTAALGVLRLEPGGTAHDQLVAWLDPHFPADDPAVNRELHALLVQLGAPNLIPRLIDVLKSSASFGEGAAAARSLSAIEGPWTIDQRRAALAWFETAAAQAGAGNFVTLAEIRNRLLRTLTEEEQQALSRELARPFVQSSKFEGGEPRAFVREWTVDEAVAAVQAAPEPRDLAKGRRLFGAAQCFQCHAVGNEGAMVGPRLDGAGRRFALEDLLRAMIEPNHAISDQYRQTLFMINGKPIVGRLSNLNEDQLMITTDLLDPTQYVAVDRDDIDSQRPSAVSVMPSGLLNTLTGDEIADLVEFLKQP